MIKRCSAIQPVIGHMKMNGGLNRNPHKGVLDDTFHAVICGAERNLRLILTRAVAFLRPMGTVLVLGQKRSGCWLPSGTLNGLCLSENRTAQGGLDSALILDKIHLDDSAYFGEIESIICTCCASDDLPVHCSKF